MGWTIYTNERVADPAAECRRLCTWENEDGARRVLADELRGSTWYAAVEHVKPDGSRVVWGAVFLIQRAPFGYKDMSEDMGPYERAAPAAVLDLLTPTEAEFALQWRWDCRERLAPGKNGPRPVTAQERWNAEHADAYVASAAWGDWAAWVPAGKVGVVARRARDGAELWALIDADEYTRRLENVPRGVMGTVILDPARHEVIDKPANTAATKERAA